MICPVLDIVNRTFAFDFGAAIATAYVRMGRILRTGLSEPRTTSLV